MKLIHPLLWVLPAILLVSGCNDVKESYYLNQDGTGKVELEFTSGSVFFIGSKEFAEEESGKDAQAVLEKSEGIEAWNFIETRSAGGGKTYFKATAYFSDLQKVRFYIGKQKQRPGVQTEKMENNKVRVMFGRPVWTEEQIKEKIDSLSPGEKTKQIAEYRKNWEGSSEALGQMMASSGHRVSVNTGGKIGQTHNLAQEGETVVFEWKGPKVMEALDKEMKNDDLVLRRSVFGPPGPESGLSDLMATELFGKPGFPSAELSFGNGFDYEAELAVARESMAKFSESMEPKEKKGPLFKSIRLEEIDVDQRRQSFNGIEITLVGELPEPVEKIKGGILTKFESDTGEDLLPEKEFWRKLNSIKLNRQNKSEVAFEIKGKYPKEKMEAFKKIAGYITYTNGSEESIYSFSVEDLPVLGR